MMPSDTSLGAPPEPDPKQKYYCTYCGKDFTRKEHLERHLPKHTGAKPFKCRHCHLGYNRKDLLQRHIVTMHELRDPSDSSASNMAAAAGQRNPIACERCFKAKTKCDRKEPCENCLKKGLPNCKKRYSKRSGTKDAASRKSHSGPSQTGQSPALQQGFSLLQGNGFTYSTQQQHINPSMMNAGHTIGRSTTSPSQHGLQAFFPSPSPVQQDFQFNAPMTALDPSDYSPIAGYSPGTGQYIDYSPGFANADPFNLDLMDLPMNGQGWGDMVGEMGDIGVLSGLPGPPSEPLTHTTPSSTTGPTPPTRQTSLSPSQSYDNDDQLDLPVALASYSPIAEFEVVVKAEAAWPLARCTKQMYSNTCPKTALTHLTCFERYLRQNDIWRPLERFVEKELRRPSLDPIGELNAVVPLTGKARDEVTAITQQFLHKALDIHVSQRPGGFNYRYVILPPASIIQYFLQSYVRGLSVYYPLVVGGRLDPNQMLSGSTQSTLLLLLMIAQGAAAVPVAEARYLSTGLTETCRISLFDNIEKNVGLSADAVTLRCALLFTLLGAWSGDKWLMDISMGQRNMYLSMLSHSGMLEAQQSPNFGHPLTESHYKAWIEQESRNRLVNNWIMLDQELALFHDVSPLLAITDLRCPLPASEKLWMAHDWQEWAAGMRSLQGSRQFSGSRASFSHQMQSTKSVFSLHQDLLQKRLSNGQAELTPQELRLLLHPIQGELSRLRQSYSCFSGPVTDTQASNQKETVQQRINETSNVLDEWHQLAMGSYWRNQSCPLTRCNLVMYHLICLNVATNFPAIESLARREGLDSVGSGLYLELSIRHEQCVYSHGDAIYHCGEVLGLLHQMPARYRPAWWTAAMYRAVLILWADSLSRLNPHFRNENGLGGNSSVGGASASINPHNLHNLVAIDVGGIDKGNLSTILQQRLGVAVLQLRDRSTVSLDSPLGILGYGISMVDEADNSRFGDGIRRKLHALRDNWKDVDSIAVVG